MKPKTKVKQLKAFDIKIHKEKPPSRSNSSISKTKEDELKMQIRHLQEKMDLLKQASLRKDQLLISQIPKELTETQIE